jgi:flagellar biosynthetic protein FlhB
MVMLSKKLAVMLLPIMFVLCVAAYVTQRLQVGKIWYSRLFNRSSATFSIPWRPAADFHQPADAVQLGKQIAQAAAIAVAPYLVLKQEFATSCPCSTRRPTD